MISILVNLIFIIILGIIQVSFLTTWPLPISSLNLILSLVIFLTVIVNYQKGLWWAVGGGLFLELYTSLPFGIVISSLFLVALAINFLFNNFFTNRSLYSLLILGFIATIFYNLMVTVLKLIAAVFGFNIAISGFSFRLQFIWQPFLNLLVLTIIFFAYYIFTGRLRNMFLSHQPSIYEAEDQR